MSDPRRRSLTNVGGASVASGDREAAALLRRALDVPPASDDDEGRAHVHGFHTYPARMHPVTAGRLVEAFAPRGGTVLDPFCGSGTVLVEARIAGRASVGTDLNPLAVKLARLKTAIATPADLDALVVAARDAAGVADARRKARAGATQRFSRDDVAMFDPHVLLELDGLRAGIAKAHAEGAQRETLLLVLSSILVKMSKQQGDTSSRLGPRRLAAGFAAKTFVRKCEELAGRLAEYARMVPSPPPPVAVHLDDATRLKSIKPRSIDCAITSPPYVATYDYVAQHAVRLRWLSLDAHAFERGEMGARRRYAPLPPSEARAAWSAEMEGFLRALGQKLRPRAKVVLLMADSAVGSVALRAEEVVAGVAGAARLSIVARASQTRPHFHDATAAAFRGKPRAEHAILLEREG